MLVSDVIGTTLPFDATSSSSPTDLLDCTAQIVTGHVSGNQVTLDQLPELIAAVHRTLAGLGQPEAQPEPARPEPAVPIRRSVTPEYVVCLECGVKAKMLKRHLAGEHGLSPAAYRQRWNLPRDYPLTAPSYSEKRSGLAKQIGLGRKPDTVPDASAATMTRAAPAPSPPARSHGRRRLKDANPG